MADIPNFKPDHLTTILDMSMSKIGELKVKDINHILLAYFTRPELFTKEQLDVILDRISTVIAQSNSNHDGDLSIKTC